MSGASLAGLAVRGSQNGTTWFPVAFPMDDKSTLFRLCNTTDPDQVACKSHDNADACTALQSCQARNCPGLVDKPQTAAMCAMTKCAETFTQCYGDYCVPWTDPRFVQTYNKLDLSTLPKSIPASLQTDVDRYNNIPRPDWAWNNTQPPTYGVTAGICMLAPPIGRNCSNIGTVPNITQISFVDDSAAPLVFSVAACQYFSADGPFIMPVIPPGGVCGSFFGPCMFGGCVEGLCEAADSNARHVNLDLKIAAGGLGIVILVWFLRWWCVVYERRKHEVYLQRQAEYAAEIDADRRAREDEEERIEAEQEILPEYKDTPGEGEVRLYSGPPMQEPGEGGEDIEMQPLPASSTVTLNNDHDDDAVDHATTKQERHTAT
ncbi:hypothetical protein RI367_007857 [Sorochytrium milnesiophthora]